MIQNMPYSKNMVNFKAFQQIISSSIKFLFLKSDMSVIINVLNDINQQNNSFDHFQNLVRISMIKKSISLPGIQNIVNIKIHIKYISYIIAFYFLPL